MSADAVSVCTESIAEAVQDTALLAAREGGLLIDLAMGPNQGAGVPAEFGSEGLAWDLQPFNITIPANQTYSGTLPGWSTGPLVSVSTGLVLASENTTSGTVITLSEASISDVSAQVLADGTIRLDANTLRGGTSYVLFAYYLVHTDQPSVEGPEGVIRGAEQSPVEFFWQNGSWIVDHFSFRGAEAVMDIWQDYLLAGNDTLSLLSEVGNFMWEDSAEFKANLFWTPTLPAVFEETFGYDIRKYLPLLMGKEGNSGLSGPVGDVTYITDGDDGGDEHIERYRQTVSTPSSKALCHIANIVSTKLTVLNREYLKAITDWSHSLGMQSSAQIGYNLPIDMLSAVPEVDAPECETFGFVDNIDIYRQYVGPASLAGKDIVSAETGAEIFQAYQQFIPRLVWSINRAIIGGVNRFVLHGMPYSGAYPNSTWPSFTPLFYIFAELHNRHLPAWDFYGDFMNYTARCQYIMQSGVAKVDIAFWLKNNSYVSVDTKYLPSDLVDEGFSYEYLSPDSSSFLEAEFSEGLLAPSQQAFKALVVRANDTLTVAGAQKLEQLACQGLPIFFSGGLPGTNSETVTAEASTLEATLSTLVTYDNVHIVPYEQLAASIRARGIIPRTHIIKHSFAESKLYTRWREVKDTSTSYIFVFNDAIASSDGTATWNGTLTLQANGVPHFYDPWTGLKHPVEHYNNTDGHIAMPLTLRGNQSAIVAAEPITSPAPVHVESSSTPVDIVRRSCSAGSRESFLIVPGHEASEILLSNGSSLSRSPSSHAAIPLHNWELTIEAWRP